MIGREPGTSLARFHPKIDSRTLKDRAASYVEAAERPLVGQRNNSAFRLAGHLYAMEHDGEVLTNDAILDLMKSWNTSLPETLPDDEIASVVAKSARNGTPRERKPARTLGTVDPDVDLSCILSNGKPTTRDEGTCEFPAEALEYTGFISELANHCIDTAIYPQPQLDILSLFPLPYRAHKNL